MNDTAQTPPTTPSRSTGGQVADALLWLVGVILPIVTLAVELGSGISADIYFDPIPTAAHVGLVAFGPLSIGVALWALRTRKLAQLDTVQSGLAFAMGISGVYALLFLPISPMGVIGIVFFGMGLLPLAPLLALICCVVLWRRASRMRRAEAIIRGHMAVGQGKRLLAGLLAASVVLVALEVPMTFGQIGTKMAASQSESVRNTGVHMLRMIDDDKAEESACSGQTIFYPGLISPVLALTSSAGRHARGEAFYRATGRKCFQPRGVANNPIPAEPTGHAPVSLVDSSFDGRYHAEQGASELDWTFAVDNASRSQQEARMLVQIPHGAVVSEVTLWIEGEPKEAEFDEREKVTRAYEAVVAKARDPILVRSSGPDRIEVRCFPVPPGGEMRAKIRFTIPAQRPDESTFEHDLPHIIARDFHIATHHEVRVASDAAVSLLGNSSYAGLETEVDAAISRNVADRNLSGVRLRARNLRSLAGAAALPNASAWHNETPQRLIWVIDGSKRMAEHAEAIAKGAAQIPYGQSHSLIFAGDSVETAFVDDPTYDARAKLESAISEYRYAGGRDNVAALERAYELAEDDGDTAIVWIHAPQTMILDDPADLEAAMGASSSSPTIFELQVESGVDEVLERLEPTGVFAAVPRHRESVHVDIAGWLAAWGEEPSDPPTPDGEALERLDAHWRAMQMLRQNRRENTLELANRHRLVTPVSAAIVLEPGEDLDRMAASATGGNAGSGAAAANSGWPSMSSSTPEPEVWAMLLLIAVAMLAALRRRPSHA